MVTKIKAALLVWDESLYPRHYVSEVYINRLVEALRAGEKIPPIVIDQNKRIIDGVHRWRANVKLFGDSAKVECEERKYKTDAESFLDAISENSHHGLQLTPFEQTRCLLLAQDKGISKEIAAKALRITVEKADRILSEKTAVTKNGVAIALKGSFHDFSGETLNKKQVEVNEFSGGLRPLYYINQVIGLVESGILIKLNETGVLRLGFLRDLLIEKLPVLSAVVKSMEKAKNK